MDLWSAHSASLSSNELLFSAVRPWDFHNSSQRDLNEENCIFFFLLPYGGLQANFSTYLLNKNSKRIKCSTITIFAPKNVPSKKKFFFFFFLQLCIFVHSLAFLGWLLFMSEVTLILPIKCPMFIVLFENLKIEGRGIQTSGLLRPSGYR